MTNHDLLTHAVPFSMVVISNLCANKSFWFRYDQNAFTNKLWRTKM